MVNLTLPLPKTFGNQRGGWRARHFAQRNYEARALLAIVQQTGSTSQLVIARVLPSASADHESSSYPPWQSLPAVLLHARRVPR